jgi:hypothetical protein
MPPTECTICFETLGKTYKKLPCGHKFHFGCITIYEKLKQNENLNCPYCREQYSVMKLRKRKPKLTKEEQLKKDNLTLFIKGKLKEIETTTCKNKKTIIVNQIFNNLLENIDLLKNTKYGFTIKFVPLVIFKLSELIFQVQSGYDEKKISKKQHNLFMNNRSKLLQELENVI